MVNACAFLLRTLAQILFPSDRLATLPAHLSFRYEYYLNRIALTIFLYEMIRYEIQRI